MFLFFAFLVVWGNGYSLSEKRLFGRETKVDLMAHLAPADILQANVAYILWGNLRVTSLFPGLLLLLLDQWIYLPLTLLMFLTGTILAVVANILLRRIAGRIGRSFYLLSVFIYLAGCLGILWLLVRNGGSPSRTCSYIWLAAMAVVPVIYLWVLPRGLAELWRTAYLHIDDGVVRIRSFKGYKAVNRFLSNTYGAKEWVLWWRNTIMYFRLLVFVILLTLLNILPFFQKFQGLPFFCLSSALIWIVCFGELPSIVWQNEGDRRAWLWLPNRSPGFIIGGKLAALGPLFLLSVMSVACVGLLRSMELLTVIEGVFIVLVFLLSLSLSSFALALPSWNRGREPVDPLFEQSVVTVGAVVAHICQLPFAFLLLLPPILFIFAVTVISALSLVILEIFLDRVAVLYK